MGCSNCILFLENTYFREEFKKGLLVGGELCILNSNIEF